MADKPLPAYQGDEPFAFVSYSHEDVDVIYPEIRWLQDQGFNIWYDEGISGASRWRDAIADRIQQCQVFVFYVSGNSVASSVCREELEYALAHDRLILSSHVSETQLPEGIKLAIDNRQALHRYQLDEGDYSRKLVSSVAHALETEVSRPIRPLRTKGRLSPALLASVASGFVITVALTASIAIWLTRPDEAAPLPMARFELTLPPGVINAGSGSTHVAIDASGQRIFVVGSKGYPHTQVYARNLDGVEFEPVAGSEHDDLIGVFPSPGGATLGLAYSDGALNRISGTGGQLAMIAQSANSRLGFHARWVDDQTMLVQDGNDIVRLDLEGGKTRTVIASSGIQPAFLAAHNAVVYVQVSSDKPPRIVARSLDTDKLATLAQGTDPRITSAGHLLFFRDNTVWASRLSADGFSLLGDPVAVLNGVSSGLWHAQYDVSDGGTLVFQPVVERNRQKVVSVTREGLEKDTPLPLVNMSGLSFSPDGSRVAYNDGFGELWLYAFDEGLNTRVADMGSLVMEPFWMPNGESILFTSWAGGRADLFIMDLPSGEPRRLIRSQRVQHATSFSQTDRRLLVEDCERVRSNCDIATLQLEQPEAIQPILDSDFNELSPQISPDGRYLAYSSDEFGPRRIIVRPYPDVESGYWQAAVDDCDDVNWSALQDELLLYCEAGIYAVPVTTTGGLNLGEPKRLFSMVRGLPNFYTVYSSERREFFALKTATENNRVVVILNWFGELDRLIASGG